MAKLSPDYVNWVLTLNATQAQEEFHKLEKDNKELQARMNASRKAMSQLEAQGKKGSAEWKNLRKVIDIFSPAFYDLLYRIPFISGEGNICRDSDSLSIDAELCMERSKSIFIFSCAPKNFDFSHEI